MKSNSGLRKVVKTVRGKHGSYRRAYNVKSGGPMSAGQFLRRHGAAWAGTQLATGLAGGAAGYAGARHGARRGEGKAPTHAIVGYLAGSVGAAGVAASTSRFKRLRADYSRMGVGGRLLVQGAGLVPHVAGMAAGFMGAHKLTSAFRGRGVRAMNVLRPRTLGRSR